MEIETWQEELGVWTNCLGEQQELGLFVKNLKKQQHKFPLTVHTHAVQRMNELAITFDVGCANRMDGWVYE